MGTRGPEPKRSEERIRRADPTGGPTRRVEISETEAVSAEELAALPLAMKIRQPVEVPAPPRDTWHPVVQDLWESAQRSGAAIYYEPADWHLLRLTCESISRDLDPQPIAVGKGEDREIEMVEMPIKGASLVAYTKILGMLGFTESERRRMGIEVARARPDVSGGSAGEQKAAARVTPITSRQRRLG